MVEHSRNRNLRGTLLSNAYRCRLRIAYVMFSVFVSRQLKESIPPGRQYLAAVANRHLVACIQHLYEKTKILS